MNKYYIEKIPEILSRKDLTKYVSAFLLGDGSLLNQKNKPHHKTNAHYVLWQIAEHKDYVLWQADILSQLTRLRVYEKDAYVNSQGANAKPSMSVQTMSLPFYTTIYNRWYKDGRKIISAHDLKLLDWEVAAILYQDDGYIEQTGNYVRIRICTDCYTYGDVCLLRRALKEKLDIGFDIIERKNPSGIMYRLQSTKDMAKRFLDGVAPYMQPSFQYKLYSHENLHING